MMKHECKPITMADWANEVCSICGTSLALPSYNNLAEAIQRVRELHKPDEDWPDLCAAPDCNFGLYPCGTIRALDGEQ